MGDGKVVDGSTARLEGNADLVVTLWDHVAWVAGTRDIVRLAVKCNLTTLDGAKVAWASDLDSTERLGVAVLTSDIEAEVLWELARIVDFLLSLEQYVTGTKVVDRDGGRNTLRRGRRGEGHWCGSDDARLRGAGDTNRA